MPDTALDANEALSAALGGDGPADARGASAFRLRSRLQPAAGPGAKVMPPTYSGDRGPIYIEEQRRLEGEEVTCVLLDSVASQANRLEDALADAVADGEVRIPTVHVDQGDFGVWSGLHFSHRCFDAWVEDAHLNGDRFGETELFRDLASSTRRNVTRLMETFPVGILLGCWASRIKNPQGTTRLARILASEIIAVNAVTGARAAGRIDKHHVSGAIKLFAPADGANARFALDEGQAGRDKNGKPEPFAPNAQADKRGKPSAAGYGNVTPQRAQHGGITMDYALQLSTVSLPALRECRFPREDRDPARDLAGRRMLAALALHMLAIQVDRGYDLRSGCLLVPEEEPAVELVGRIGRTVASWPLLELQTGDLLERAVADGQRQGISWSNDDLHLVASDVQLELLGRSLATAETEAEV